MTGTCMPGTPPSCNDNIACTVDACDEMSNACVSTPHHAACDDSLFCNGAEVCNPVTGCGSGSAPNCGDCVGCTEDSCDESFDACIHTPSDAACNDAQYCNGVEACDAGLDCVDGLPVECGDSVVCSTDTCNEATDSCAHDFSPCVCGDGEVTGTEQCDPPETAGTFEDCNNHVDDDGDGKKDCRDLDFVFLETSARVGGAHIVDLVEAATGLKLWIGWAKIEVTPQYSLPEHRNDYAGLLISLARQERPDMSGYNAAEVVWRLQKKNHAGLVVRSSKYERIGELMTEYSARFYGDFFAMQPLPTKATD